jgi:hypothetical protein
MGPGATSAFTRVFDALWAGTTHVCAVPLRAKRRPKTTVPGARPGTGRFPLQSARQFDALGRISMIPTWLRPLIAIAMPPSGVGIM